MRGTFVKLGVLVAILVGGFLAYRFFFANQAKKPTTTKVKRGDLVEELTVSGKIDAEEKASLRFQASGYLAWLGAKEGDYVQKYQTLASLDRQELEKNLKKYLATYQKTRDDFEAAKDSQKDQVITDTLKRTLDQAQMDLNSSVLDVEIKDIALKYGSLWTPVEGLVTHLESPNAGVNVTPAQSEIEVVNPKTVYLAALADQTEVTRLYEGQQGELVLDAYPERMLSGTIRKIAFIPATGETGTVYEVRFFFGDNNDNYQYKLGMTGDLTLVIAEAKGVLYLPNKFVKTVSGKKQVNVVRGGKAEKIKVETGLETDSATEIKKGLSEGEIVND